MLSKKPISILFMKSGFVWKIAKYVQKYSFSWIHFHLNNIFRWMRSRIDLVFDDCLRNVNSTRLKVCHSTSLFFLNLYILNIIKRKHLYDKPNMQTWNSLCTNIVTKPHLCGFGNKCSTFSMEFPCLHKSTTKIGIVQSLSESFSVWKHMSKSLFCAISNRRRSIVWSFALLVRNYDASNAYSFCIVERMQSLRYVKSLFEGRLKQNRNQNQNKTFEMKWNRVMEFWPSICSKTNIILFYSAVLYMLQSVSEIHISCEWLCFGWIQFNRICFVWFCCVSVFSIW